MDIAGVQELKKTQKVRAKYYSISNFYRVPGPHSRAAEVFHTIPPLGVFCELKMLRDGCH